MSDEMLHEGIWIRQVLKWKRKVRVAFIPDDATHPLQSTKVSIDDDSKTAWKKLLGDPPDSVDIDLGIILVRFNENNNTGTARFLPNQSKQDEIVHTFQQADPANNTPGVGLGDFLRCIDGKKTVLGVNFNYPRAFSECLPQLVQ